MSTKSHNKYYTDEYMRRLFKEECNKRINKLKTERQDTEQNKALLIQALKKEFFSYEENYDVTTKT